MKSILSFVLAFALTRAAPYPKTIEGRDGPSSLSVQAAGSSNWWYPNLDHSSGPVRDYVPNLSTYNYPVYKAVDNAADFRNALYSDGPNGGRENGYLAGEPRVVYIAPGTYVFDSTVFLDTDTVIIGDAINPPTIKASSNFNGDYLLVGGDLTPGSDGRTHGELHFSVMIKNVILDTTANTGNSDFTALSWLVAQNCNLVNVVINMPQGAHTGIDVGQGSTIQVGDVTFNYGSLGVLYTNQQATLKGMKFNRCTTGIKVAGGFTLNILGATFDTVGNPIVQTNGQPWVSVVDAVSRNSGVFYRSTASYPNFMIENISKDNTNSAMVVVNGKTKVGGRTSIGTYVHGNTYGASPVYQTDPSTSRSIARPDALAPGGKYPIFSAPQYPDKTIDDVINLKDSKYNGGYTLKGDDSTNDGPALQNALNYAARVGKLAYLPFGIYLTKQTITIPLGTQLIGNGWSTISGSGSLFADENNPAPVVRLGNNGETGVIQIQDMRFTVREKLAGAIILEVSAAGTNPGDVAIHNSLVTVGGTRDSRIDCGNEADCKATYLGMYLKEESSAYLDNVWVWLADHASDMSNGGIHMAGKGGLRINSQKATWLVGIGVEHFWLFNMNLNSARNVFVALFQSETNYYQGDYLIDPAGATPPDPFSPGGTDPDFSYCDGSTACPMTVNQYINGGGDIFSYASGSWNFNRAGTRQGNINVEVEAPTNSHFFGLCSHEGHYVMRLPDGTRFGNGGEDGFGGSWGSLVAEYSP